MIRNAARAYTYIMRFLVIIAASLLFALVSFSQTHANVLYLHNGGKIEGELLNPDESPREKYIMRLDEGAEVTFKVELVKKCVPLSPEQKLYKKFLPKMPDSAAGNWKMANWCKKKGLRKERQFHAEETVRHDPDHELARRLLGYKRVDGKWTTTEEFNKERGYVFYDGKWRMPQEAALLKSRREHELAVKGWFRKIKLWRGWLGNPKRNAEALREFDAIEDPLASKAVVMGLERESNIDAQAIFIDILGRLNTFAGADSLMQFVMTDCDEEIRYRCLERLEESVGRDKAIDFFVKRLTSKKNEIIYRAGIGLTQLTADRAVRPLIDALVSSHTVTIGNSQPGGISTSFGGQTNGAPGGTGGIGFSAGGGATTEQRQLKNETVLDALVKTTQGPNFQYDQDAWLEWYIEQSTPLIVDLRRGP